MRACAHPSAASRACHLACALVPQRDAAGGFACGVPEPARHTMGSQLDGCFAPCLQAMDLEHQLGLVVERDKPDSTSLMTITSLTGRSLRPDGVLRGRDGARMLAKVSPATRLSRTLCDASACHHLACSPCVPRQTRRAHDAWPWCSGRTRALATLSQQPWRTCGPRQLCGA